MSHQIAYNEVGGKDVGSCDKENNRLDIIGDCVACAFSSLFDFSRSCQNKARKSGAVFTGATIEDFMGTEETDWAK